MLVVSDWVHMLFRSGGDPLLLRCHKYVVLGAIHISCLLAFFSLVQLRLNSVVQQFFKIVWVIISTFLATWFKQ